MADSGQTRTVGLWGATGVGIGAIVGGGILVLAGVAFERAGPAAMVAFAINGVIALITALSFAELASAFPESGGAYAFARKVLSVRAAFAAGWTLWFAYIVAGALYALGFAHYADLVLVVLLESLGAVPPEWLTGRNLLLGLGFVATGAYAFLFMRRPAGGRQWATVGKVVVFAVILAAGLAAVLGQAPVTTVDALAPFFSGGFVGLAVATGLTFIALQGFEIIAAIAGEVKSPERTIPRAMFLSLGAALAIYLPILFIVATVGVAPGGSIAALASGEPETVMAVAVRQFMGPLGYWLVIVAAILATLSALGANILAASRVALAMANDRTLPKVLGRAAANGAPVMAIATSALVIAMLLVMMPDLAAAGSAASLIFLIAFGLGHVTAILARRRGGSRNGAFCMPLFPVLPVIGGVACAALALFQALMVPSAGFIALFWLGLGVIFYLSVFAGRAQLRDALSEAFDPDLVRLRGRSPLVLLPVANPKHAASMAAVASAMAPPDVGRVLLLTIVGTNANKPGALSGLADAQKVVARALAASHAAGQKVEALVTMAASPWSEIQRVARVHQCESLLLGLGQISGVSEARIEHLANNVDCDVAVLRAPETWRIENARCVLVPMGGRGEQHELRARIIGSILRGAHREITIMRVVPEAASEREVESAFREVEHKADDTVPGDHRIEIVQSDDAAHAIIQEARAYDLVILGLHREAGQTRFTRLATRVLQRNTCPTIFLSAKR